MNRIAENKRDLPLKSILNVRLFSLLLLFSPVVDVITGALLLSGYSLSLSIVYKGIVFLLCVVRLSAGIPKSWMPWLIAGLLLSAASLLIPSLGFDLHVIVYNVNLMIKCYVAVGIVAVYYLFLSEEPKLTGLWVKRIFQFYCYFFPLSIIVPGLLGMGFSTYVYGVGFKGFYFAGNDISIVLVVVAAISADMFIKKSTLLNAFQAMLAMLALLLISTKTCLLMAAVIAVVFVFRSRKAYFQIGMVAAAGIIGLALCYVFQDEIAELYHSLRYKYRWYQEQGGTIFSFLLSGRDEKLKQALELSYQTDGLRVLLFGTGAWQQLNLSQYHGLIEMDLFDLLVWHGLPLTVSIIVCCAAFYHRMHRNTEFVLRFCWWSIVGFSVLVGHVLFSPMANMVLALVCVAMMCQQAGANEVKTM